MGEEKPVEGEVSLGEHMIKPNYYEQNQSEALDPKLTVLKTLELAAPDAELQDIKAILGRMMFSGAAMDKKVTHLGSRISPSFCVELQACDQQAEPGHCEVENTAKIMAKYMLKY